MPKFIVDTHLPPKLARFLSSKGFHAIHTTYFSDGHLLGDEEIRRIAIKDDRIVITKDSDFLDAYFLLGTPPCVLLLQFGNIGNTELIAHFERDLPVILQTFESGAGLVSFSRTELAVY